MNSNDLISVIIPTLNCENYIGKCLDSIIHQKYSNKEIWIIDNLSSDGTIPIIKGFAAIYPFVNFLSEEDNGVYDAMNKGIKLAKGKWIIFLGADDSLVDEKVFCNLFAFEHVAKFDLIYGDVNARNLNSTKYDGEFDINKLLKKNICHQAIFFKKDIFKKLGNYDTHYKIHADYVFNIKCFTSNEIVKRYVPLLVANFEGGISVKKTDLKFIFFKFFCILKVGFKSRTWKDMIRNLLYQFSGQKIKHLFRIWIGFFILIHYKN